MSSTKDHTLLVANIRAALGRDPRVVLWSNPTGKGVLESGARISWGIVVGGSDLIGMLRTDPVKGHWFVLEAKTGNATTTKEQKQFLQLIRTGGGFGCVVHSVDEAKQAVERAIAGASE